MGKKEFEITRSEKIGKSWLFDFYSPVLVLAIGIAGFLILLLAAGLTDTRFYSVLGAHYTIHDGFRESLFSNTLTALLLILTCIVFLELIGREIKMIRIINAVLISRLPFLYFTLFNINNYIQNLIVINFTKLKHELYDFLISDLLILGVFVIVGLGMVVYSVWLLLRGLKTITGKLNKKEILIFCLMLLAAEVISRLLIQIL